MLVTAKIIETPIDVDRVIAQVESDTMGATCVFVGRVRNHDQLADGEVVGIEYLAHPDAQIRLQDAVKQACAAADDHEIVSVVHRIGSLGVGDVAMVVAVSSPHRSGAFALCPAIVDQIKADVPIWKKQVESDGSYIWAGLTQ